MAEELRYETYVKEFVTRVYNNDGSGRLRLDVNASMAEARERGWFEATGQPAYLVRIRLQFEAANWGNKRYLDAHQELFEGPKPEYVQAIHFPSRIFNKRQGRLVLNIAASVKSMSERWYAANNLTPGRVRRALQKERNDPRNMFYLEQALENRRSVPGTVEREDYMSIDDAVTELA
ncbi:hypothetical protein KY363_00070 [Candidatus Woesearchaeota archaeon]|nr:hypothetical protein [Candidatus Woesearchaeota archaeon]